MQGVMNKITLRQFDELCLTPVKPLQGFVLQPLTAFHFATDICNTHPPDFIGTAACLKTYPCATGGRSFCLNVWVFLMPLYAS